MILNLFRLQKTTQTSKATGARHTFQRPVTPSLPPHTCTSAPFLNVSPRQDQFKITSDRNKPFTYTKITVFFILPPIFFFLTQAIDPLLLVGSRSVRYAVHPFIPSITEDCLIRFFFYNFIVMSIPTLFYLIEQSLRV